MELLKLTALTSGFAIIFCLLLEFYFAIIFCLLLEFYFAISAKPYLFGFPRTKWPLLLALSLIWAISFKSAYYLLWQRSTFYGSK
jgi:hypothetical protein